MEEFGYAFNNIDFSDRILRIEFESCDWGVSCMTWLRHVKRVLFDHSTDKDSYDECCSTKVVELRTLNINSQILASESPFFRELFENETTESSKKEVTLTINASEEEAMMDLLNYMHINTLSATRADDLLSVLKVATRFEVTSCIRYCDNLLQKLPKPPKYEVLYPKPSRVKLMAEEDIQPLKDKAKKCLVDTYKDFTKSKEEAMRLPLSALEVVLSSDGLQVHSEDNVFRFILNWADAHYPKREDAQEIVITRLLRFVHVPYLSLKTVQAPYVIYWFEGCQENYNNMVPYLLLQATHSNSGLGQCNRVAQDPQLTNNNRADVAKRVYIYHPVRVVNYFGYRSLPPRCMVYFFLTRQDMENLFMSKQQHSMSFYLGKNDWRRVGPNKLHLLAKCNELKQNTTSSYHLGLYVVMKEGVTSCTLDYEFSVLVKEEYKTVCKVKRCTLSKDKDMDGEENLFGIPWTQLMADDSEYFIDGILHLRAHLFLGPKGRTLCPLLEHILSPS